MEKLKELFESNLRKHNVPGASLIFQHGSDTHTLNYGTINVEDPAMRVSGSTIFQIGSLTKVFTALLMLKAVDEKMATLGMTVGRFLDAGDASPYVRGITIGDLLLHRSGLPRLPDNFGVFMKHPDDPYLHYGIDALYSYLRTASAVAKFGEQLYSNLGYGLIGVILEQIYEVPYRASIDTILSGQLEMPATTVYEGTLSPLYNVSAGYDASGRKMPYWNMNVLKAAGAMVSTPLDMARLLLLLLDADPRDFPLVFRSVEPLQGNMSWGWFHRVRSLPGHRPVETVWHNGMTGGFSSHVEIDKAGRRGFALLMNKGINPSFMAEEMAREVFVG
jgi:CubicO group peptidase (beta-lactamase class C family)